MSSSTDKHGSDPVVPELGLGANFETAPRRALELSTAARVAGMAHGASWEPSGVGGPDDLTNEVHELRGEILRRDGRCVYCGLRSSTLQLDSTNDLHIDLSPENLVASDPLCHGYHHLGDLEEKHARVAYLPGLDPTDVNHLQRLLIAELHEGNVEERGIARELIVWLASHDAYTKDAYGTANPAIFGEVLSRVDGPVRMRRGVAFEGLALVFNPTRFREFASAWRGELMAVRPRGTWASFYQDVMRLLA